MRRFATAAVVVLAIVAVAVAGEVAEQQQQHIVPGASAIFTSGNQAWLVFCPADGSVPIIVETFTYGGDVPVPPTPTPSVSAIWIIENQEDRTAAQAQVMDDPVWQAAALAKGLTVHIEDKDGEQAAPMLPAITIPLPVVCTVYGDGEPVAVVPLPATVEGMRNLIGGAK